MRNMKDRVYYRYSILLDCDRRGAYDYLSVLFINIQIWRKCMRLQEIEDRVISMVSEYIEGMTNSTTVQKPAYKEAFIRKYGLNLKSEHGEFDTYSFEFELTNPVTIEDSVVVVDVVSSYAKRMRRTLFGKKLIPCYIIESCNLRFDVNIYSTYNIRGSLF